MDSDDALTLPSDVVLEATSSSCQIPVPLQTAKASFRSWFGAGSVFELLVDEATSFARLTGKFMPMVSVSHRLVGGKWCPKDWLGHHALTGFVRCGWGDTEARGAQKDGYAVGAVGILVSLSSSP